MYGTKSSNVSYLRNYCRSRAILQVWATNIHVMVKSGTLTGRWLNLQRNELAKSISKALIVLNGWLANDVQIKSIQADHAFALPSRFRLILVGELVPTRQSPNFVKDCLISWTFSEVISCWYVLDMPRIVVAAILMTSWMNWMVTSRVLCSTGTTHKFCPFQVLTPPSFV